VPKKISFKEFINLDHTELSSRDPEYFEKMNEIIEGRGEEALVLPRGLKSEGFLVSLKKNISRFIKK